MLRLLKSWKKAFNKIKNKGTKTVSEDDFFTPEDYAQIDMAREEIKEGQYKKVSSDKELHDLLDSL
jgi:predicted DNA-binding protein